MSSTANILTGLGEGQFVYKELNNSVGILTGPRCKPKLISAGLRGYNLGLHNGDWSNQLVTGGGGATYYVRIVPICSDIPDPDGNAILGTPTVQNVTKATTFTFLPFPDSYYCTGYKVYAGTVSGTLYLQGSLTGRFSTYFAIGTTWTYVTSTATLTAQTIGPPAFASAQEVYQLEGSTSSRLFLGGGKKYEDGYAKVAKTTVAPVLTGGKGATSTIEDDYTVWAAITDGSFRTRMKWLDANGAQLDSYIDFDSINFTGAGSMADVATTLQTKLRAFQYPRLITGTPELTVADWTAITDGSFDIYFNGTVYHVTSLDFSSGVTTLTDVATVIQAGLVAAGLAEGTCAWDATAQRFIIKAKASLTGDIIVNGGFGADTDWSKANSTISANAGHLSSPINTSSANLVQNPIATTITGKKWTVTFTISNYASGSTSNDGIVQVIRSTTFSSAAFKADGTYTFTVDATSEPSGAASIQIQSRVATSTQSFDVDNVSMVEAESSMIQSYLYRHSSGTGTDISTMLAGRETSSNVQLNRYSKASNSNTLAWSTDHFIVTGATTGHAQQIGFFEACLANKGTDISTLMSCQQYQPSQTYQPGQTALRSLLGTSTKWGDWAEGMKFRVLTEGNFCIVNKVIDVDHIYLDSDYDGDALLGYQPYVLQPYSAQHYISALGNPFKFDVSSIVPLPTNDSDEVMAITAVGPVIATCMDHHVWLSDGVEVTSPRLIDSTHGCPFPNAAIAYKNSSAIFTGHDFMIITGSGVQSLDPDKRVRHLISRITDPSIQVHGLYEHLNETDLIKWYLAIDDSTIPNVAVCYEPNTGNWWMHNIKNANCSGIIRDVNKDAYSVIGQKWDEFTSTPAFSMLQGTSYKNDGASQPAANDRFGVIGSIGAETKTAGYLTMTSFVGVGSIPSTSYFTINVDGNEYLIGPCDITPFTFNNIVTVLQNAIRSKTGGMETVEYLGGNNVLRFSSGTTTNKSSFDYLKAGYALYTDTDISGPAYLNGTEGYAVKTPPTNTLVLNLLNFDGVTAASVNTDNDGESGAYVFLCDSQYRNGQYARVVSNTATSITVSPSPATTPAAGWFWFIGGIVPSWLKWMDFSSPQHKDKIYSVAVTTRENEGTTGNILACHGYQKLLSTIRTTKTQQLGTGEDPTNTFKPDDQPATQHGVKLMRPHTEYGLEIDDITITHRPVV